jgi:membrane protease YdiL (CAAX protease family)
MRKSIDKLRDFLGKLNIIFFILIIAAVITGIALCITSLPFAESISKLTEIEELQEEGSVFFFFAVVIIAPLIETLIFQSFILLFVNFILSKFKNESFLIPVFISAIVFGIYHNYNLTYMILGFIVGLVLASSYVIVLKRKENPILIVAIIHSLVNFIPFYRDFLM